MFLYFNLSFYKKLKTKQKEKPIVDNIADILVDLFSDMGKKMTDVYGEFCSKHQAALEKFKEYKDGDRRFADWHRHKLSHPLLGKRGMSDCALTVAQRPTKYPLLIEALLKSSEDVAEKEKLQIALAMIKKILEDINTQVAEKQKSDRLTYIYQRIEAKSDAIFKDKIFKKSDVLNRKLKFEGNAFFANRKNPILVVVLTDCLFFLQEQNQKFTFYSPELKSNQSKSLGNMSKEKPIVASLQDILIREKAGEESHFFIISKSDNNPLMWDLKIQHPKDVNVWIHSIR